MADPNQTSMKLQIVSLLCLISLTVKAQNSDHVKAKVFYKLSHAYDTTDAKKINVEDFYLQLGANSWNYKSYTKFLRDSAVFADSKKAGHFVPPLARNKGTSEEIFILPIRKKLYFRPNNLIGNYLLSQKLPELNWKLENHRKKVGSYTCQKASCTFNGRSYTAWFTSELPFKAGPWKLQGLPGLILEAYDSTGRIKFDFVGFRPVKNGNILESGEKQNALIAWQDFKKIVRSYESDPKTFFERRLNATISNSAPFPKTLKYNGHINYPLAEDEIYQ